MSTNSPAETVLAGLSDVRSWQEELYKDLHANPELSHQEARTAGKVAEKLTSFGFDVHEGIGGTGVIGILANGNGPRVLLRADMDALPVEEQTDLPYASTAATTDSDGNGVPVAHACGHDAHVTCLLGASSLLASATDSWSGTLVALFQPGEERGDGARAMVNAGLSTVVGDVDVALAQHVMAMPVGRIGTRPGPTFANADSMRITVYGRGTHGSMPQSGVDPVVLASMIVLRLQTIVAREIGPTEIAVVTVGSIQAGTKSNVISDHAVLLVNTRTYDDAVRKKVLGAIERIVIAECQASRSPKDPEFELFDHFPLTDNDESTTAKVRAAFDDYFGDAAVDLGPVSASEDFSDIPNALGVPYTYWCIGGIDADLYRKAEEAGTVDEDIPANHSPFFAPVIQPTLDIGTQTLVVAALAWLSNGHE